MDSSLPHISKLGLAGQAERPTTSNELGLKEVPCFDAVGYEGWQDAPGAGHGAQDDWLAHIDTSFPYKFDTDHADTPYMDTPMSLNASTSSLSSFSPPSSLETSPVSHPSSMLSTPYMSDDVYGVPTPAMPTNDLNAFESEQNVGFSYLEQMYLNFNLDDYSPQSDPVSQFSSPSKSELSLPHDASCSQTSSPFSQDSRVFNDGSLFYPTPKMTPETFHTPLPSASHTLHLSPASLLTPSTLPHPTAQRIAPGPTRTKRLHQSSGPYTRNASTSTSKAVSELGPGREVYVRNKAGDLVMKYECPKCERLVGRGPDLKRHQRRCVLQEEYHCVDIIQDDGTLWKGCSSTFSRRDACYRHLQKRLKNGQCTASSNSRAPTLAECASIEEYEMRSRRAWEEKEMVKRRRALDADEKNRLSHLALSDIKQPMFKE